MTVLMGGQTLPYVGLEGNHRGAHLVAQPLAVGWLESSGLDRFTDQEFDRSWPQVPCAFGENLEGVMHVDRDDGDLRRDGEAEWRVLEWQQLPRPAAGPFGKHHGR